MCSLPVCVSPCLLYSSFRNWFAPVTTTPLTALLCHLVPPPAQFSSGSTLFFGKVLAHPCLSRCCYFRGLIVIAYAPGQRTLLGGGFLSADYFVAVSFVACACVCSGSFLFDSQRTTAHCES